MTDSIPTFIQYGALGLLALVLFVIGRWVAVALKAAGKYLRETIDDLRGTLREVRDSLQLVNGSAERIETQLEDVAKDVTDLHREVVRPRPGPPARGEG